MLRLGLGLAALGRPAYITAARGGDLGADRSVAAMRQRTATVLDAAYAAGVRYVDTARSYGRAEEFLATWLTSQPDVTDVTVASKWGYRYVGDWDPAAEVHEAKDHSLDAFVEQWSQTRAVLGGRVGVYQVHSVTPESPVLADAGLLAALGDLRDSGVRVGLTTSGPSQAAVVRRASEVEAGGRRLFDVVQSTWNLLEPSAGAALAEASTAGLDVVVKECLANGRLAGPDAPPAVTAAATEAGATVAEFAMAAALAQPWVTRVLTGAVTTAQIAANVRCTHLGVDVEAGTFAEDPARYWTERSRRSWT